MDYFLPFLKVSSTVFNRNQRNVIDWVNTAYNEMPRRDNLSPTGSYALATNIAKVNTGGFETDVQFTKNFSNDKRIWTTLGFTWLDTKTNETTPSFYISSSAKCLVNLAANYQWKQLALNVTAIYKKRNPMEANAINVKVNEQSCLLNTRLDYVVIQNKLACFIEADNVLNNHSRDLVNSLEPSRWVMAGVKLSFDK
jgi:iron complex outermembrane receptor protein